MKRKLRIMVVDDEMLVRGSLRSVLDTLGYQVTTFRNPLEALEVLGGDERYDVAIVDLKMPEMSGEDFIGEAHRRDPRMRCVVLTAHAERRRVTRLVGSVPLVRILLKPWKTADLLETLDSVEDESGRNRGNAPTADAAR